jgi:hypothetical protein
MKIELIYFDGCPSWKTGLENLKKALQLEQLGDSVELVKVSSDSEATLLKFLGSPSFHVNGKDVWPEERDTYALSCRIYTTPTGMSGWPSVKMLREILKAAKGAFQ